MIKVTPNPEIIDMLATPGIHAIGLLGHPGYFKVEVTKGGKCYQLTQDLKRDGLLSYEGWHPDAVVVQIS